MEHKKTKIVLDADVIIHFMEANYFSILPDIFPEYKYLILDVVYNEISQNSGTKDFIDKYLHFFPKLKKEVFSFIYPYINIFLILPIFIHFLLIPVKLIHISLCYHLSILK